MPRPAAAQDASSAARLQPAAPSFLKGLTLRVVPAQTAPQTSAPAAPTPTAAPQAPAPATSATGSGSAPAAANAPTTATPAQTPVTSSGSTSPSPAALAPPPSVAGSLASSAAPPPSGPTLRMSMDDAVQMALQTSLGLKSDKLDVNIADENIIGARASFLPTVSSTVSRNTASHPLQVFSDGTVAIGSSAADNVSGTFSQQLPWYGEAYSVNWQASRDTTGGGASSTFNPQLGSTLNVSFTQPLWRGFSTDPNRTQLDVSTRQRLIADITLQQQVVQTQVNVKSAYLGLVEAIEERKVAQQNMDLAQESLHATQERVAAGQEAPIDIVTYETLVESDREQLIIADAAIASAEDQLREQVLDPARPDYWQVYIDPTDTITVTPQAIDIDAVTKNALDNRLDLAALKHNIAISDLNIALNRNLTRPAVNVGVSYSSTGSGGTELLNGVSSVRPFTTVLGDTFGGAYPSWTFGVTVGYPIGRTSAQAALAQSELQKQQQRLSQQQLQLQIVGEVRQAVRDVQSSFERVQATQAARQASERQLQAEQQRFEVGLSDTFTVQSRQSELAEARVTELNATIAYNSALIELDRVQKIGP